MNTLSLMLALIPILWLLFAFLVLKMPGYKASLIALPITGILAFLRWHMTPDQLLTAALEGGLTALWPICLVILSALFAYNITVETGAMGTIRKVLANVSTNELVLLLIIGYGFGGFMEGIAGFGTAVAIPTGILVGIGLDPIPVIIACALGDAAATAFGSVGLGFYMMSSITGLGEMEVCRSVVILQLIPSLLAPFLMVLIYGGWKGLRQVLPVTILAAVVNVGLSSFFGYFVGGELPYIIGPLACMVAIALSTKLTGGASKETALGLAETARAWAPFLLIFVLLLLTSSLVPEIQEPLKSVSTTISVYTGENPASVTFQWLSAPGVTIFLSGILGGLIQGASPGRILRVLGKTLTGNYRTVIMICCILAIAKIMGYSGMTMEIATCLILVAGRFYPLISPLLGGIGGFITGSASMTTVLFGKIQTQTAAAIGVSPAWLAAANMYGSGVGKMISLQTLTIGTAAAGITGKESEALRKGLGYALLLLALSGLLCYFM